MNNLFDACTLVFLTNGNLLEVVLELPGKNWFVGQIVFEECRHKGMMIPSLQLAVDDGRITLLDDSSINASDFLSLLATYGLGDGETECLSYAQESDFIICTDDKKATKIARELLGDGRVVGTLTLMKEAVNEGLIPPDEAYDAYLMMRAKGAFLPIVAAGYFNPESE